MCRPALLLSSVGLPPKTGEHRMAASVADSKTGKATPCSLPRGPQTHATAMSVLWTLASQRRLFSLEVGQEAETFPCPGAKPFGNPQKQGQPLGEAQGHFRPWRSLYHLASGVPGGDY